MADKNPVLQLKDLKDPFYQLSPPVYSEIYLYKFSLKTDSHFKSRQNRVYITEGDVSCRN